MRLLGIFCIFIATTLTFEARGEGAIVVSKDRSGLWAGNIVINARTKEAAVADGMRICTDHPYTACEIKQSFNQACGAVAYSRSGAVSWIVRNALEEAKREILKFCNGRHGGNCVPGPAHCDTTPSMTFVCLDPIFEERRRLLDRVEHNLPLENWTVEAVRYLERQYCVYVPGTIQEDRERERFDSHCYVSTGMHRGERVYWQGCDSYE